MQIPGESLGANGVIHYSSMFPTYFLSSYVLGVRLYGPVGDKKLLIDPRLGDLPRAEGTVVSELNLVPVAWKMTFCYESDTLTRLFLGARSQSACARQTTSSRRTACTLRTQVRAPGSEACHQREKHKTHGFHRGFVAGAPMSAISEHLRWLL